MDYDPQEPTNLKLLSTHDHRTSGFSGNLRQVYTYTVGILGDPQRESQLRVYKAIYKCVHLPLPRIHGTLTPSVYFYTFILKRTFYVTAEPHVHTSGSKRHPVRCRQGTYRCLGTEVRMLFRKVPQADGSCSLFAEDGIRSIR